MRAGNNKNKNISTINNNNNNIIINNKNNIKDNNMEPSFYEDNAQYTTNGNNGTTATTTAAQNSLKRPASLDLNIKNPIKKERINQAGDSSSIVTPLVLNSPDLQNLKFNTPDLEKFILSSNLPLQTPTPSLVFPCRVTSEQEDYAKGFVDALNSLRNSENHSQQNSSNNSLSSPGPASALAVSGTTVVAPVSVGPNQIVNVTSTGMSGGSITYTNLDESFPTVAIKDEPQTVPNSPPYSPIDMETQEKIKLERKRQRNRVAASKCRKRKLERISKLEDKVKMLKVENADLASIIKQLKEHVFQLKQEVINHITSGCNITLINASAMIQTK